MVSRMLRRDVTTFMLIFSCYMIAFGTALHTLYLGANADADSARWVRFGPTLEALVMLSFMGGV